MRITENNYFLNLGMDEKMFHLKSEHRKKVSRNNGKALQMIVSLV